MNRRASLLGLVSSWCLIGCAHSGPSLLPSQTDLAGAPSQIRLEVPYFPDAGDQCGPATLASLLTFWGKPTAPASLRQEMYTAKLHGTLPSDLFLTAQNHGLHAEMVKGTLDFVQRELLAGRPVLAMLNLGFEVMPIDHYVVLTGFDTDRDGFYMHSGPKRDLFMRTRKFVSAWKKTDYWTMSLADSYIVRRATATSAEQYQAQLATDPHDVPALLAMGNKAFEEGRLTESRSYFRRALKASPGDPAVINNLAMVDVREGTDLPRAERMVSEALLQAGPFTPYLQDTLAQIKRKREKPSL